MTLYPEWHPQSAILLTWPHHASDWFDCLTAIEAEYRAFCQAILPYTPLKILCYDETHQQHVMQQCPAADNLEFIICPTNGTWIRDYGPLSLADGKNSVLLDIHFNAWGNKYAYDLDADVPARLHALGCFGNIPLKTSPLIVEGGNLETDGQGTLLTHWTCWQQRYPNTEQAILKQQIRAEFKIKNIIFIQHGALLGDDTDSHIDNLVRFANPNTLVYVHCDDPADPHYQPLCDLELELKRLRTVDNKAYQLIPLPLPIIIDDDQQRLPASYANFLISNACVIMPAYGVATDNIAQEILTHCFPQHTVIPVPAHTLISQFGSWHCATMQVISNAA